MQHFALIRQLRITGGVGFYSNAVNFLAADLEMYHAQDKVVFGSSGTMLPCHFLSRGEIRHAMLPGRTPEELAKALSDLFQKNSRLTFVTLVLDKDTATPIPWAVTRNLIEKVAREHRFASPSRQTFYQRDTVALYEAITFVADCAIRRPPARRGARKTISRPSMKKAAPPRKELRVRPGMSRPEPCSFVVVRARGGGDS